MRSEQLEHAAALARAGSFTRAARDLHLSQPALSASIRKLERELGIEIFQRTRTGVVLSAAGRDLLPLLLSALDSVDRLRAASRGTVPARPLRIGTVHAATASILAPVVQRLAVLRPDSRVEVTSSDPEDLRHRLRDGHVDLTLMNYLDDDATPEDLGSTTLLRGRPIVCVPRASDLAMAEEITPDDLLAHPLILMAPGYAMHRLVERMLGAAALDRACVADGAEMGKMMVAEGLGITVLPDYSVMGDPLERAGLILGRTLATHVGEVRLVAEYRLGTAGSASAREFRALLTEQASVVGAPGPPTRSPEP